MAIIKTLKDFLTKATLYPITKTQAVYDDTVGRLDSYLQNTLGAEPIDNTDEESTDLIDADTLGGRYTAEDLDAMPKSTAIEDYANIEPPITDADRLGGKYTAKDIDKMNDDITGLNSSLTASDNLKFRFSTDGEGNYGYLGADDSFIPFKSGWKYIDTSVLVVTNSGGTSINYTLTESGEYIAFQAHGAGNGNAYGTSGVPNSKFNRIASITNGTFSWDSELMAYHIQSNGNSTVRIEGRYGFGENTVESVITMFFKTK